MPAQCPGLSPSKLLPSPLHATQPHPFRCRTLLPNSQLSYTRILPMAAAHPPGHRSEQDGTPCTPTGAGQGGSDRAPPRKVALGQEEARSQGKWKVACSSPPPGALEASGSRVPPTDRHLRLTSLEPLLPESGTSTTALDLWLRRWRGPASSLRPQCLAWHTLSGMNNEWAEGLPRQPSLSLHSGLSGPPNGPHSKGSNGRGVWTSKQRPGSCQREGKEAGLETKSLAPNLGC